MGDKLVIVEVGKELSEEVLWGMACALTTIQLVDEVVSTSILASFQILLVGLF